MSTTVPTCSTRRPGWDQGPAVGSHRIPCILPAGHDGEHRDGLGQTWSARQPGAMPRDVYERAVALVARETLRKSYALDYGTVTTEQLAFLVGVLTRSLGDVLGILDGNAPGPFTKEAGR